MTFRDDVMEALRTKPGLTDRELANLLLGQDVHPSQVNQHCRALHLLGLIERRKRPDGRFGNFVKEVPDTTALPFVQLAEIASVEDPNFLSEDEVKRHLQSWLAADGWSVVVQWGRSRGIDIEATKGQQRWIIEAKGEGTLQPMRVNYFIGMLGETLQRMEDANAQYSIAMPDMPQFRGLWQRLPSLAKTRTQITALFVTRNGCIAEDRGGI